MWISTYSDTDKGGSVPENVTIKNIWAEEGKGLRGTLFKNLCMRELDWDGDIDSDEDKKQLTGEIDELLTNGELAEKIAKIKDIIKALP